MSYLALHDPLTGLANLAALLTQLDKAISRLARHPSGLAIAFMDLDHFKLVNDRLGHRGGDELLAAVASRFAAQVRPEDTIARFGGDEFVALFEQLSDPVADGGALAKRLHPQVASEFIEIAGQQVSVTATSVSRL